MGTLAIALFHRALLTAVLLMLPVVGAVALVGVLMGIVQTIVQIQDQNVAFAPKIALVAVLVILAGPTALSALRSLFTDAIALLPLLAHA